MYQVQIQRQVAQIEVYQAQFKEQQDRREAQELQVRELRGEVKRREGQVTQREGELKELRKREAALEAERSWLRDRIRQMQATRFWRLGTLYWRLHSRLFSHAHVAPLASAREPAPSNAVLASPSTPPPPARPSARDDFSNGVRELTVESLPREASVAVVNDPGQMRLQLAVRQVISFPVMADLPGSPLTESARTAIVQLEVLRARGAEFLLISQAAFPWLKRLAPFKRHLEERYRLAVDGDAYLLFSLREAAAPNLAAPWTQLNQVIDEFQGRYDRDPEILDWSNGLNLARSFPGLVVFSPLTADGVLPYLDETVDIVVIASADTFPEARRVARAVVVTLDASGATSNWKRSESEHGAESVSIIIPCHNGANHTDNCLAALRETLPHDFKGEIIVVDDASTDETPAVLERWSQREPCLKVLRNEANGPPPPALSRAVIEGRRELPATISFF